MNKLVCGRGVFDKGNSYSKVYQVWVDMYRRCYDKKYHIKQPTYIYCEVDIKWQYFSNFEKWFISQYKNGYVLDKDIFIPNNKIYSPDLCIFIPRNINNLFAMPKIGKYMRGVSKRGNSYRASISIYGKRVWFPQCKSEIKAHNMYIQAKINYILDIADNWKNKNIKVFYGLYRHAEILARNDWEKTLPKFENKS